MTDWITVHGHSDGGPIYIQTDKIVAVECAYKLRTGEQDGGYIKVINDDYLTRETADEIMKQIMGVR